MKASFTDKIISYIWDNYSKDLSVYNHSFLSNTIKQRASFFSFKEPEQYFDYLMNFPGEAGILILQLNNSYSEFFRNPLTFALLESVIFPNLILQEPDKRRNELRIWSTACAAGQEAYSLAILLEELKAGSALRFDYRIFATDINPSLLEAAEKGEYVSASLNNVSIKRGDQWFNKQGGLYKVKSDLKSNIDFSEFDLLQKESGSPAASIYGDFNLIMCANILFYYNSEFRKKIIERAKLSLAEGGYLVTGETERDILWRYDFHEVFPHSAIFQLNKRMS